LWAKVASPLRCAGAVHDAGGRAAENPKSESPEIRRGTWDAGCGDSDGFGGAGAVLDAREQKGI